MIDPASGSLPPHVGVILAARLRPAFIIVLRGRADGDALPGRYLGLADEEAGLRAVLGESAPPVITDENKDVGPLYIYELSGPAKASRSLAGFAADGKHAVIDMYLPGGDTTLPSERFAVSRAFRRRHVEHHYSPGAPPRQVTSSQEELGEMLLDAMTGACK